MDLVELVVNGSLPRRVLLVQLHDQVMGWLGSVVVGVVAVTKEKLAACRRMRSDAPTARLVTVVFLYELIDASADGTQDAELRDIRTEA